MKKNAHRTISILAGAAIAAVLPVVAAGQAAANPVDEAYVQAAKQACADAGYQYDTSLAVTGFRPASVQCVDDTRLASVFVPIANGTACTILDGLTTREGRALDGACLPA